MDPESCLYHKDKDAFNSLQKQLQKCGWLPRKCVHRLAMAVCACRKHKGSLPSRDEFLENRDKLQKHLEDERDSLPTQLLSCIEHCLNTASETDYSYSQFIAVLTKAKLGDNSMLSRAVLSTNSKISERDLQREINRKKKLTAHQIEIIKNKKKKKMNSGLVKLQLFPGNFLKLKLDFVKEMKGFIEPQSKMNNANFENKTLETWVKVWGDPSNIKSLADRLKEEAKVVQERMDNEWKVM
ncbi:uncharacterized protein LOC132721167 [Ruditapes philippinarum]|uniref:uncharacterized protein LOC132721167 n=1 Tax=Ruditapes philippinarum TaxID=129788 RepID=UPI00295B5359|nr:uncharacterized protein LOC132721167 [Ruditapes philippinarum]XP_060561409.1 uncharacterized protein LOC132721167 [Ruditapes philippinarum]